MVNIYTPVPMELQGEYYDAIFTTEQVEDLPEWILELMVEAKEMNDLDKEKVSKHLPGQHDQSRHGRKKTPPRVPVGIDVHGKRFTRDEKLKALMDSRGDGENYLIDEAQKIVNPLTGEPALDNSVVYAKTLIGLGDGSSSRDIRDPDRILEVEGIELYDYTPVPSDIKLTEQEIFDTASQDWVEMIGQSEPVVIVNQDTLMPILEDGKVKSVFETGENTFFQADEVDTAEQYLGTRAVYENMAFGYTNDSPADLRPISGTLLNTGLKDETQSVYGGLDSALIVLKPETRERTTITLEDSLNTFGTPKPLDSTNYPFSQIDDTTITAAYNRQINDDNYFLNMDVAFDPEIQIHGGVNLGDIDRVILRDAGNGINASVTDALTEANIPFEIED